MRQKPQPGTDTILVGVPFSPLLAQFDVMLEQNCIQKAQILYQELICEPDPREREHEGSRTYTWVFKLFPSSCHNILRMNLKRGWA